MVEGELDEFVHGVARFRPQPLLDEPPSTFRAQQMRIEPKGTIGAGAQAPAFDAREGCFMRGVFGGPQRFVKPALALGRDLQEAFVGEAQQRRFQHAGQRQIILRQQRCAPRRHEIHHRDVLQQLQSIGARHRHALFFQRADHRIEEGVAAAHENHHIARADGAAQAVLVADAFRRIRPQPARDEIADAPRQNGRRIMLVLQIDRHSPVAVFRGVARAHQRPDLHHARQIAFQRAMCGVDVIAINQPAPVASISEYGVHAGEDPRRGTKGELQRHAGEIEFGFARPRFELAAHLVELVGLRALKGIDGLLLVAYREEGAREAALPLARHEFFRQSAQNVPLAGRCVLRLIHENMVDAGVELIENPACGGACQKVARDLDEIVEIKQRARILHGGVAAQDLRGYAQQRGGAFEALHRFQQFARGADAQ